MLLNWRKQQRIDHAWIQPNSGHARRQSQEFCLHLRIREAQEEHEQIIDPFHARVPPVLTRSVLHSPHLCPSFERRSLPVYLRVTSMRYDTAREQELVQFTEQQLIPAFRRVPGFRRYIGGVDRATGRGVSITEWHDLQHAQLLREAIGPALLQGIADVGAQLEHAQFYEVTAQT